MLLAMIWFVGFASVAARLPAQELESLRVIAGRLGKGDWDFDVDPCSRSSGWATRNPVQGFENAVTCDCGFGNSTICHVTSIVLNAQNLNGSLPVEFVRLQFLRQIELSRNFLNGTIPPQWGFMKLVNISLNGNRITGSIPEELGNITTLQQLDLEYNQLSGTIPPEFGDLPQIRRLLFTSNNLTGELPASLAKLTTLTDFRVSDNNFIGSIPNFVQNWTNMEKLVIQASGLAGPIPSGIASLTKMTDLRISDLNGNDSRLPSLSPLKKLKTLILRSCNIVGTLPEYIGDMTTLKLLDLSFNKLKGPLPESFINLSKTEYIYLTGNSLSGPLPDWMLKGRKGIDLSYNNLTYGSLPAECQNSEVLISCFSKIEEKQVIAEAPNTGKKLRKLGEHNFRRYIFFPPIPALSPAPSPAADAPGEGGSSTSGGATSAAPSPAADPPGECGSSTSGGATSAAPSPAADPPGEGGSSTSGGATSAAPSPAADAPGEDGSSTSGGATSAAPSPAADAPGEGGSSTSGGAESVAPSPAAKASGGGGSSISGGAIAGIVMVVIFAVILVLGVLWWKGCLTRKDWMHNDLKGGSFTLRQLKAATNNFAPANKIGEGGFGPVFKGVLPDGTIIAVKQLSSKSRQGNREFLNEIGMISALQHPRLVKLYGCCMEGNQLMVVYEYMENNNLARALFGPVEHQLHLDWPMRQKICIGIARGLAYLHEETRLKIVHRDIKATNVLLDEKLVPKISDFGLAKLHEEEDTHISTRIAGTFGYMAPEYAMRGYLTDKADVYSFGVVVLEIVSGRSNNNSSSSRPNEDSFYLLDWANSLKVSGNLLELVDRRLESSFNEEEIVRAINVALICTNVEAAVRPSMSSVVSLLEGEDGFPEFVSESSISVDKTRPDEVEMGTFNDEYLSEDVPLSGSSTSAADLYPIAPDTNYWEKRGF